MASRLRLSGSGPLSKAWDGCPGYSCDRFPGPSQSVIDDHQFNGLEENADYDA
jgi:hypothetical protein